MRRLYFFSVIVCLVAVGCASKNVRVAKKVVKDAYEIQKPLQVARSGEDNRPDWVRLSSVEEDGKVYFSGGYLDGSDYSVTVRCANAEAMKVAVQGISQFIRSEFTGYVHGSNSHADPIDRYVSEGIAFFTESLHLQGVKQVEIYYEENFSPAYMQSTYNVWVKLEMNIVDYMKAKADALRQLREGFTNAGEIEAKEKAEQLLEELKESGV